MQIHPKEKSDFSIRLAQAAQTNPVVNEQSPEGNMARIKLMPLTWFVEAVFDLPDFVMENDHGVRLPQDWRCADSDFFNLVRKQYRSVGDWLKYYLLGRSDLSAELTFTGKAHYKSDADVSLAFYRLAQETFLLSNAIQEYAGRPEMLWLLIEAERCENLLKDGGFIDIPKPTGKADEYQQIKRLSDELQNLKKLQFGDSETLYSPTLILINEAAHLASQRENIKFRRRYEDFWRILKRSKAEVRDNSSLQIIFLEQDTLKTGGNGRRGKGKVKRGFGSVNQKL